MVVAMQPGCTGYCLSKGWEVGEVYVGEIRDYHGKYKVLVTNRIEKQLEYHYLRLQLKRRNVELIATNHLTQTDVMLQQFVDYVISQEALCPRKGGRPPYGFRWVNGEKEIDPEEFAIVREMIAMRNDGLTLREIARNLEEKGYRTRKGRKFTVSTIQLILKNRNLYDQKEDD